MYCGTQEVIDVIGGTKNYSVGTATDADMTGSYVERMIQRADNIIDGKLMPIFGTQGFGTSSSGTRGVPNLIKDISADLSGWLCIDNLTRMTSNAEQALGTRLYGRGMSLLNQVISNELSLGAGYEKDETNIPHSSDLWFNAEENVVLNGTNMTLLKWAKIIPNSGTVFIKDLDGTTQYTPEVDFKMYYYNDPVNSGTNYGHIRRLGTTITDGQEVRVLYKVWKDNVFGVRDARMYGHIDSGVGSDIQ